MKTVFTAIVTLLASVNGFAAAKIQATDSDNNRYVIVLDSMGKPRINGNGRSYPSIKDFREGGENIFRCIDGTDQDIRKLLTRLVEAADGDGDSYAELKAIYKNPRSWAVLAEITNEAGIKIERFVFPNCR